jgi:AraC family transcriptional regulator, regulatory protein of adaptative response / DNA-3-methyladenine glycosylase II
VRAILGQQITVKGATTLAARFVDHWGERLSGMAMPHGLTCLFPRPNIISRLAEKELADAIGIPSKRALALIELARAIVVGRVDLSGAQGPEVLVGQLLSLPGIGPWTAQYISMRAVGDPDAFPAGDPGLRKALADKAAQSGDPLPSERELLGQEGACGEHRRTESRQPRTQERIEP